MARLATCEVARALEGLLHLVSMQVLSLACTVELMSYSIVIEKNSETLEGTLSEPQ